MDQDQSLGVNVLQECFYRIMIFTYFTKFALDPVFPFSFYANICIIHKFAHDPSKIYRMNLKESSPMRSMMLRILLFLRGLLGESAFADEV
jgi:hypothetical protein